MKSCGRCSLIKEFSEFNKDKYSKTGYRSQCKDCMKKERERLSDHYKKWRSTEEKKEWYREYRKARYEKDKNKVKARNATRKLVRPESCSNCFKVGKVEAHHDDYAFPLVVRWLCPLCHNKWHKGDGVNMR